MTIIVVAPKSHVLFSGNVEQAIYWNLDRPRLSQSTAILPKKVSGSGNLGHIPCLVNTSSVEKVLLVPPSPSACPQEVVDRRFFLAFDLFEFVTVSRTASEGDLCKMCGWVDGARFCVWLTG